MRLVVVLLVLCVICGNGKLSAQTERTRSDGPLIEGATFADRMVFIPGLGEVSGIRLERFGKPTFMAGDDSLYATLTYDDRHWAKPKDLDSLAVIGAPVHWARFHFRPLADTIGRAYLLHVISTGHIDVYLDGIAHMRARGSLPDLSGTWSSIPDSAALYSFPVVLRQDVDHHVLAIRIEGGARDPSPLHTLEVSLHGPEAGQAYQRGLLHNGIFMGINALILILALVLWVLDRGDGIWTWLAALALITAFIVGTDLLEIADLGVEQGLRKALIWCGDVMVFWPLCLLVIMLANLMGGTGKRKLWLYISSAAALALMTVIWKLMHEEFLSLFTKTFGTNTLVVVTFVILVLMMMAIILGFFVEIIRLGIAVARSKGYIRWLGAGALLSIASPLLPFMYLFIFAVLARDNGPTSAPVLERTMEYFQYIGMPLCIVIALAIRSSHQNRMLARQRDDLDNEVHERTAELRQERDRSEALLLNILPHEVAEELKRTGASEARHFDQASVLFSDFKGFTAMSERLAAGELLEEINTCFKAFDDIIGARGVEKIKTIGDAYMCAGGLPDPKSSTPADVVMAALEMQSFMEARRVEREAQGQPAFAMRVGIHTGPVVAGIVGVKKFQYDIWGDTVNTASRMESSGEVGRVNISPSTYALVKDEPGLRFIARGKVEAKGKGEMEMYFVERA